MRFSLIAAVLGLLGLAPSAPPGPVVEVVHTLAAGSMTLPRFPGTLESVTIEPLGACTYFYRKAALIDGPAPWSSSWWAGMSYTVRAFDAPLYRFDAFEFGGTLATSATVERVTFGPFVESAAGTAPLRVTDRARLAAFEGTDPLPLQWGGILHVGMFITPEHSVTWGPSTVDLQGFGLRVTMRGTL